MKINLLDEEVYSKIAAGEVIDRPASVVREVIDNSIDAGSTEVSVYVEEGGIKKITIIDDGDGIERDDLELALMKYATSKIKEIDDLFNIATMGFRGEALYSIKTVSKLTITTNTDSSGRTPGNKISYYNDYLIESAASKKGTTIEVEDIFYNLPARKKFLKSKGSEFNALKKILVEKVFSHLDIKFNFYADDKLVFATPGDNNFENTFFSIYKNEDHFKVHQFEKVYENIKIKLFYSEQSVFFTNRKHQIFFVNGRPITASFFYSALSEGAKEYVSPGRYPLFYVYIDINPELIDINIHPAKKEIKFYDQADVFGLIRNSVIKGYSSILKRDILDNSGGFFAEEASSPVVYHKNTNNNMGLFSASEISSNNNYTDYFKDVHSTQNIPQQKVTESIDQYKEHYYKILGTVFDTYIIVETDGKVLFVDQHAVAEQYIYIKKKEKYDTFENEKLLIPEVVDISWNDHYTQKKIDFLNDNGFMIDRGEGSSITIREVPSVFFIRKNYGTVIKSIVHYLEEEKFNSDVNITDNLLVEASCREAVKKGDKLTLIEVSEIIDYMFKYDITNCPHGRPVYFEVSQDSLEKVFQRKK